jgi:CubicO group peptidase (beta-lactamase class C family)
MSYSNPGYWLAGYLVETITGKPYGDAMDARVFQPLGTKRTTLRPLMAMTWPLVQGHEIADGQPRIARPAADNTANRPAGSIFSNLEDLSRFAIAFMNEGRIDGKQVLDPRVIAQMSAAHFPIPGDTLSYGHGLEILDARGVHFVQHGGSCTGYGSDIRMIPAQRVAVIVQTNRTGTTPPSTEEKALELAAHLEPKPAESKPAKMAVSVAEVKQIAGVYRNGDQSIDAFPREGKLYVKIADREFEFIRYGEKRFSGGVEFTVVRGADGAVRYLHAGLRAFARVP